MKAFLILEDGTVLTGESFGAAREVISEVVFNTSMTGYLEILTDPSYAGQSVVMTYPLIGNYGICMEDMESIHPWPKALIVRECAKLASNFRNEMTLDEFLKKYDVPGISGIDTRHLTRILREYGVMNGMITTREDFDLDEVVKQLKNEGYQIFSIEQAENTTSLENFSIGLNNKYALIFGNEVKGVQQEVIDASDGCIEIPQFGTKHSFNISVTAGMVLWQVVRPLLPHLRS